MDKVSTINKQQQTMSRKWVGELWDESDANDPILNLKTFGCGNVMALR